MSQSFTSQAEAQAHGMATGYRRWFGFPIPTDLPDDRATRPSSFLISSAEDLTHLLIAELNGRRYGGAAVLSAQGIAETQSLLWVAAPRFMNAPLRYLFYFAPDIFWLTIAVVAIPLCKDLLKVLLTLRRRRVAGAAGTAQSYKMRRLI